jgi:RNA polymerase sigma factor (sigma-70 family)
VGDPGRRIDDRLVAAYRAGDRAAFDRIFDRYRATLVRYARRTLRGSSEQAEDVVQEAMFRASRALLRDDRQMHLRPWLFRLTRNCALDELSRVRTDSVDLDLVDAAGALRAAPSTEPEEASERRSAIRTVLGDVAVLPDQQRHALLRREVDGLSIQQLAAELDVTPQAAKSLVFRARTNLVKQRDARTTTCPDVQRDLLVAHDGRRRASAATYRHLTSCGACRSFRSGLRGTRRSMAILSPGPLLLAGIGAGLGAKLLGGTASAATSKAGATVAVTAVAAGAVGLGVEVFGPGEPSPQNLRSVVLAGGTVAAGERLPAGTAVVRRTVRLRAGAADHAAVTLPCPRGLRVADLLPSSGAPISVTYTADTVPGVSTRATLAFERRALSRPSDVRLAVLCKRADASGSLLPGGRTPLTRGPTSSTVQVGVRSSYLRVSPGGGVRGSVRLGQPVRLVGAPRGGWQQVVTDAGETGWLPVSALGR